MLHGEHKYSFLPRTLKRVVKSQNCSKFKTTNRISAKFCDPKWVAKQTVGSPAFLYVESTGSSFFLLLFSSLNLSGRRLDVYHTSTHGVALVRIGGCAPLGRGAGSSSNTMWPWAEAYLHDKFHLDPSNRLATIHQRHRQTDRQTTVRCEPFYKRSPKIGQHLAKFEAKIERHLFSGHGVYCTYTAISIIEIVAFYRATLC